MSFQENRPSGESPYQFDDSIFKPQTGSRVQLPGDEEAVFEEVQHFSQIWLWVLMGIELVIILIAFITSGQPLWTAAMGLGAVTLTMAILSSLKLYSRIDADGVHFRMTPFHFREQKIPWEDVDQIHVRKYSPIMEYGGWGIRMGINKKAYNVRGNYGIQIVKKNGNRVLIGTQRPDEAARHLGNHPLLV
jgi:hypothetical protein